MLYPQAIIESIQVKYTGRIVLFIRCPYCQKIHYNDMGYIHKDYPYPVHYRDSRCVISLPYQPIILENSPPHFYCQYHHISNEKTLDLLKVVLHQRVKHVVDNLSSSVEQLV